MMLVLLQDLERVSESSKREYLFWGIWVQSIIKYFVSSVWGPGILSFGIYFALSLDRYFAGALRFHHIILLT